MMKRVGDWRLEEELNFGHDPVVVLFTSSGVGRGREARLAFRALARDYFLTRFFEVDLAENPALETRFDIHRVPTLVVFVEGEERVRDAGHDMRSLLRRVLGHEPHPEPEGIDD